MDLCAKKSLETRHTLACQATKIGWLLNNARSLFALSLYVLSLRTGWFTWFSGFDRALEEAIFTLMGVFMF
jgi:hypothetical protein